MNIGDRVRVNANQQGEEGMEGIIRSIDLPGFPLSLFNVEITYVPENLNTLYGNSLREHNDTAENPFGYYANQLDVIPEEGK